MHEQFLNPPPPPNSAQNISIIPGPVYLVPVVRGENILLLPRPFPIFDLVYPEPYPEPDPENLTGSRSASGSDEKVRIRPDPDPQHWWRANFQDYAR